MSTARSWMVLGQQVVSLRRKLGVSQRAAAREMKIGTETLRCLEEGTNGLSGVEFHNVLVWISNAEGALEGVVDRSPDQGGTDT